MLSRIATLVMFALFSGTVVAGPAWVNIDITEKWLGTMIGPGVIGDYGDTWNRYAADLGVVDVPKIVNLLDVDGNPTSVSFQLTGAKVALGVGLGSRPLFYGYHFILHPQTATITIEGLTPNRSYDLYLYTSAGLPSKVHNQCAVFTFNGVTKDALPTAENATVANPTVPGGAVDYDEDENYVVIRATADQTGTITGTMACAKGSGSNAAAINGIQITKVKAKTTCKKTEPAKAEFTPHPAGVWPSEPPAGCPFEPSKDITGIVFTGKYSDYSVATWNPTWASTGDDSNGAYHVGDTWYPTWASDGNLYSPFTDGGCPREDGFVDLSGSVGGRPTTGQAVMIGDDPLNLKINSLGLMVGYSVPYQGRYPCGSLIYNGVWYYGTYCLGPEGWAKYDGVTYNWPILGPMPGFRTSTDYGKTWTDTPHTPMSPLFPEPTKFLGPVKIGKPHFVDFGKNMEHSPDGKAYLVGHGARLDDPMPRYANLCWGTGDQIYITRVVPSVKNINDESKYEYFAGHDKKGHPIWSYDFEDIEPLLDWNNNMGCVAMTYNAPLKKYLMCITDAWPTSGRMDSYILESDAITGPFKMVTYMRDFGQQGYFLNIPSKFISEDGRVAWLCYTANFAIGLDTKIYEDPPGSRYGLVLQEVKLLDPSDG